MRFIPINCVCTGMINAKTIYGTKGELMLSAGVQLTDIYIKGIKKLGYNGIYIEDDLSKNIEIVSIITDELKNNTIKLLKDIFSDSGKDSNNISDITSKKINNMRCMVENIINDIMENKTFLINMIDLKIFDDYTYFHSVNVAILSIIIATSMKLSRKELYELGMAAILHDIGKVFIDKEILNKPGKLTDCEFELIKKHSSLGYDYLKKEYDLSVKTRIGVLQHHEKWNGLGYPDGKKETEISLYGRIIILADIFDALTSERKYRPKAFSPGEAVEYIMANSKTIFDPNIVKVFLNVVAPYPNGTCIELSNGLIAIVIKNYQECCLRPKVRVFKDKVKNIDIEPYELDLLDSKNFNITILSLATEV